MRTPGIPSGDNRSTTMKTKLNNSILIEKPAAVAAAIRTAVAAGEKAEGAIAASRMMLLDAARAAYAEGWRALTHFNVAAAPDNQLGVKSLSKGEDLSYQHRDENGATVCKAIVEGFSDTLQAILSDSRKRKELTEEEQKARKSVQSRVSLYFLRFCGYLLAVEAAETEAAMTDAEKAAAAKKAERVAKAEEKRRKADKAPLTRLARSLIAYIEAVDGAENSSDLEQSVLTVVMEAIKELQELGVKLPTPKE
jgi:hypothetical protein